MKLHLSLGALLLSSAAMAQNITGTVTNLHNHHPVLNALIITGSDTVYSDKDGKFTLADTHSVVATIHHADYVDQNKVSLTPGSKNLIHLIPLQARLSTFVVQDLETQEIDPPVENVTELTPKQLDQTTGLYLEETINTVPGVYMEKRTESGGQRITMRGYGNSTNFNGNGYKAYLNNMPLTDAQGNTILDDVDFFELGHVEIIKGTSSSAYGSGIAGVVKLNTITPELNKISLQQQNIVGSYGLFRSQTTLNLGGKNSAIRINYGHQDYDGFRDHTASNKDYFTLEGISQESNNTLQYYFGYNNSYEQLAGQLDSASFYNKSTAAESKYLDNDAHVAIKSFRMGITNTHQLNHRIKNQTTVFGNASNLQQAYAVGFNDNLSYNIGGRSVFAHTYNTNNATFNTQIGGEFQRSFGHYTTYQMQHAELGNITSNKDILSQQTNVFINEVVQLPKAFSINAGASVNFLDYNIKDRMKNSNNPDYLPQEGHQSYQPSFTPNLSVSKTLAKQKIYAAYSQGYSQPTTSMMLVSYTGEVNTDLNPETAQQIELGTEGKIGKNFAYNIAVYHLAIDNKFMQAPVVDENGVILYTYTVNAGSQSNNGIELSAQYNVPFSEKSFMQEISIHGNFNYAYNRYTDFKSNTGDQAEDYTNNEVIGVPPVTGNIIVNATSKMGVYANASLRYHGEMYLTYNNSHQAKDYSLLKAKVGYKKSVGKHWVFDVYAGGDNLTNSLYYNMVFVNWEKGPQPAIYLPGAYNANFYGGASLKYQL